MASELSIVKPRRALNQLVDLVISDYGFSEDYLELAITVDDENLVVRELTSYLDVIDRTYGRLITYSLLSYSKRPDIQLKFSSLRQGSLELVVRELISNIDSITAIIIVRYVLKYLPDGVVSLATAYRDYEEAQLARARRKQIRVQIEDDTSLSKLENKYRESLVKLIDELNQREIRNLPRAQRFARRHVREVLLRQVSDNEE